MVENETAAPCARSGHTAVVYKDYIMMFGGIQEITRELNDFHMYDINKNCWVLLFDEKAAESPMIIQSPSPNKTAGSAALATANSPYGRKGTLTLASG